VKPGEIALAVMGTGLAVYSLWGFWHFWDVVLLPR
jgi:hypothetical protein